MTKTPREKEVRVPVLLGNETARTSERRKYAKFRQRRGRKEKETREVIAIKQEFQVIAKETRSC